jgi:hypothetical protein
MDKQNSQRQVRETAKEARQGPLGRPILRVLIGGLLLAVAAWGAAEMFGESTDDRATITNQETNTNGQNTLPRSRDQPTTVAPVDKSPAPQTGTGGDSQTKNPAETVQ